MTGLNHLSCAQQEKSCFLLLGLSTNRRAGFSPPHDLGNGMSSCLLELASHAIEGSKKGLGLCV